MTFRKGHLKKESVPKLLKIQLQEKNNPIQTWAKELERLFGA